MSSFWLLLLCISLVSSIRIKQREQQLDSNQTEENSVRCLASSLAPIPGSYYMIQSKYGRYLDMGEGDAEIKVVQSISESYMKENEWGKENYMIQLIENGDGYYWVKSKSGRYLDMRQWNPDETEVAWSITAKRMKTNLWAKDSYLVKLIDDGDSYFWIKSRHGRYLDMRQEEGDIYEVLAVNETYVKKNQEAKDSFVVRFVSV